MWIMGRKLDSHETGMGIDMDTDSDRAQVGWLHLESHLPSPFPGHRPDAGGQAVGKGGRGVSHTSGDRPSGPCPLGRPGRHRLKGGICIRPGPVGGCSCHRCRLFLGGKSAGSGSRVNLLRGLAGLSEKGGRFRQKWASPRDSLRSRATLFLGGILLSLWKILQPTRRHCLRFS